MTRGPSIRRIVKTALLVAFCMLMPLTAAPVAAASGGGSQPAPTSPGVTSGTLTLDQLQALAASLPAPTAAQLATAKAMAAKDHFQGTVKVVKQPSGPAGTTPTGVLAPTPYVSVGVNWWGIYLHLTQNDVHNIWDIIWASGIGAAAAILCAPAGWLAVACAIVGGVIAYLVAELIWNYIGYWVPACGVHIAYNWWGGWSWGYC